MAPLCVFLASTSLDLKEHRTRAVVQILSSGLFVDPCERWGASSTAPLVASTDAVAECDVMILLVGFRRGFVPPGEAESITQQEYREALRRGIDVKVFLLDEASVWPADRDERRTDALLGEWRRKLMVSHVCGSFREDPESLDVLPTLMRWLEQRRSASPTAAGERHDRAARAEARAAMERSVGRFVLRREYFGSLVYDRLNDDYIPFDQEATRLFELSQDYPLEELFARSRAADLGREVFERFVLLCQSIQLVNAARRFDGYCLPLVPSAEQTLSAPTLVHLALTRACNLRCGHCFANAGEPYANELSTDEITALIDELAGLGCFQVSLGGGEPLLRDDLPDIVNHAHGRGVSVRISTNATAATPDRITRLVGLPIRAVRVSLDAAAAARFDELRGVLGAFEQMLAGVEQLRRLDTTLTAKMVVQPANLEDVEAVAALARRIGATTLEVHPMVPVGRAAGRDTLSPAQSRTLHEAVARIRQTGGLTVTAPHEMPGPARRRAFAGFGCDCGRLHCHVDARGAVSPSGYLQSVQSAATIRQHRFKDIWDTGFAFRQLRNLIGNPTCQACDHFAGCRGGCRSVAIAMRLDVNAPDYACPLAVARRAAGPM